MKNSKFNKTEILKRAWTIYRTGNMIFSVCLKTAWSEAKTGVNTECLEDFIGSDANFFANYLSNGNQLKIYIIDGETFVIDNTPSLVWTSIKDYSDEMKFMKRNPELDGHLRNNLLKLQPTVIF